MITMNALSVWVIPSILCFIIHTTALYFLINDKQGALVGKSILAMLFVFGMVPLMSLALIVIYSGISLFCVLHWLFSKHAHKEIGQ